MVIILGLSVGVLQRFQQLGGWVIGVACDAAASIGDGGGAVLVSGGNRCAFHIFRGSGCRQFGACDITRVVIVRVHAQRADGGFCHIVGVVVFIGVLCAVGGGVLKEIHTVCGVLRILRAGSGLGRGNQIPVLIVPIGLHRLLPQGDIIEPRRAGVVIIGTIDYGFLKKIPLRENKAFYIGSTILCTRIEKSFNS